MESPELKKVAKLPAMAVTPKMAHASNPTSMILPADVTGLGRDEETVNSWTPVKKAASPSPCIWPPFFPVSNVQISKVPTQIDPISCFRGSRRVRPGRSG